MTIEEEPYSLLKSYFGLERRTLLTYLALIGGALVVATCIYVAVFGFQSWKENMTRAGSLMIISAPGEVGNGVGPGATGLSPAASTFVCPGCRRVVSTSPPTRGSVPAGVGP